MDYKKYKKSRDAAWQILIDLKISALPVSVTKICRELNIEVKLYEPKDENDGFSYIKDGKAYIFISKYSSVQRQRFTAAHELGHLILGSDEQEANVFASRLLAPACVLWGLGVMDAQQIAELCDISLQAAEFRMKRMQELYARDKFLISPLEQKVYKQFDSYIKLHKIR